MKLKTLISIVLLINVLFVYGQTGACHKSTEGNDFWFGFMQNRTYVAHTTDITLTSVHTCKFKVFIGKSTTPYATGTVSPNTPFRVPLDWIKVEPLGSESIQEKGIHLQSDSLLNVYALNWSINSSDVAVIFPTSSLGKEYYAICYTPNVDGNGIDKGSGRNSEFSIVASDDNTNISITTTKVTHLGQPAHIPFSINLNKGEVYQVQSENLPYSQNLGEGDLTGSHVLSDKPIAFYSGSLATTVPSGPGIRAWDHLYEQIPPVRAWGRKFVTVPLKTRHEDTFRILAAEDNTTVRIGNQTSAITLNKGEFHEFMLKYTEPSLVESNNPVLLAQYSNSVSVDSLFTGGDGDPFMVIVSPVNQTLEEVAFVAYESQQIKDKYFVNVVVKNDAVGKIKLDGKLINFTALGTTGYSYAQAKIAKGNHLLKTTEAGKGFIAYVYGFGGVESYGYGVGYNLDIVLDIRGDNKVYGDNLLVRCFDKPPLTLNAGNAFDVYSWNTGDTTQQIQISDSGWYKVEVSTNEGCNLKDSIFLQISYPIIDLGIDRTICKTGNDVLDAGNQFTNYLWSTKDTTQIISISQSATYSIYAINKYGCAANDAVSLFLVDKPEIDFSGLDTLICGSKTAQLDVKADKGILSFERLSDNFTFNSPNVSVPDFGNYPFRITAIDQYSCRSSLIVPLGFYPTPTVDFTIDSMKCRGYNLNVKYFGNAKVPKSDFSWAFDNKTIKQGIGIDSCIVPLGIDRTARDLKLTVTDQGCSNLKIQKNIKANPYLKMWAEDSLGCVPFTARFIANNIEPVSYNWDFGNGNVLGGSLPNPSNTYITDGYYKVTLKVASNKGCYNEVVADSMIYAAPIPTAGFKPLQSACFDNNNEEIFYQGSGNTADRYIWDLSSFNNEEIVKNPLETQGPLVLNLDKKPQAGIGLKVVSQYGCTSENSSLLVKRKPYFSIALLSSNGCAPLLAHLSGVVNDNIDALDFSWRFGDGSTGNGQDVMHTYSVPNKKYYPILYGKSLLTGCYNELVSKDPVTTFPDPVANFKLSNNTIYIDRPTLNLTNSSTGATNYLWDFGDASASTLANPAHKYKVMGRQTVLLRAFNDYLCQDSISKTVLVAFDKLFAPNAFSPNAPNLADREFKLDTYGVAADGYRLQIVSRWGDIVFDTNDKEKGWDGQMDNGNVAPAGTYIWMLDFIDIIDNHHHQTGSVSLIY